MYLNGAYVRRLRSDLQASATINTVAARVDERFAKICVELEPYAVSVTGSPRSSHTSQH
jgi:hypothetical protein